jgi:uncharacterized protein Usg
MSGSPPENAPESGCERVRQKPVSHCLPIASAIFLVAFSTTSRKAASPENAVRDGAVSEDFKKQLAGYGLTTAEILYRRPDHHWLLQSYVWQNYDLFPNFPALKDFLAFWQAKLEGPLVAVTVAHSKLVKPAELKAIDGVFRLH